LSGANRFRLIAVLKLLTLKTKEMSYFQVTVKQLNKAGKVSFSASRKIEGDNVDTFADLTASFCKGLHELAKRSKERGVNVSSIKKTLPASITVKVLDDSGDENFQLYIRNFGKFVDEQPEKVIREQLVDMGEFALLHGSWA
jgi:hypothetical protein